ncbi:MAG: MarR family transcriptional regulator [Gammaproteobacteria bacterium]|nr:MarR family transcriptional regulator [Gammaproteobacteria bacterium]
MPDADPGVEVLVALRRLMRAVDLHSKRLMRSHGLSGPQWLVLRALADGECTVGELARRMRLSQATVADILGRLHGRGLVARNRSSADRRCVLNGLATAGRRKLEEAPPPLQAAFVERFSRLPSREQRRLHDALLQLAGLMDAEVLETAPLLGNEPLLDPGAPADPPPSPGRRRPPGGRSNGR